MLKTNTLDSISIKSKNGKKTIRIKGLNSQPYGEFGASFLANQIAAVETHQLGNLIPVHVEFDEQYSKDSGLSNLDHVVADFYVNEKDRLEAFVTVMDPDDLTEIEDHEAFQTSLEKAVAADKHTQLASPVRTRFSQALLKKLQKQKDKSAITNLGFSFSEVGFVQFTVFIEAATFQDAFMALNKGIAGLEKKARKLMKKN